MCFNNATNNHYKKNKKSLAMNKRGSKKYSAVDSTRRWGRLFEKLFVFMAYDKPLDILFQLSTYNSNHQIISCNLHTYHVDWHTSPSHFTNGSSTLNLLSCNNSLHSSWGVDVGVFVFLFFLHSSIGGSLGLAAKWPNAEGKKRSEDFFLRYFTVEAFVFYVICIGSSWYVEFFLWKEDRLLVPTY